VIDIPLRAREEIVHTQNLVALSQEAVAEMRTKETCTTCDQYAFAAVIETHQVNSLGSASPSADLE
jgi:hypothetical protein